MSGAATSWRGRSFVDGDNMSLKGIFFDIDGTLVSQGAPLPGAVEAVAAARRRGLQLQFLTNTTGRMPGAIAADLRTLGFAVEDAEVQTAMTCCAEYLRAQPDVRCHLLVPAAMRGLFDMIVEDDERPDIVVIADIGEEFNFHVLNRAFLMLRAGAALVVPQKNLFWFDSDGPKLDSGAFLLGLEAASGRQALVTGKPSPAFFERAMQRTGCAPAEVLVIGDDLTTDVRGARAAGAFSALVATGKYRPGDELDQADRPHAFIRDLTGLPALLDSWRDTPC